MSMFRIVRQLFLALVVILGLTLVPVGTANADSGTCDGSNGYTKPANGAAAGSLNNQPWGSVSWGDHSVTYTVNAGYEIGFCYKAGTYVDETVVTGPATGTWTVDVQQGISHIGFKIISTPPAVQKDSSFTKSISAATCSSGEVLTYSGSNVAFSGPASGVTGPKTAPQATVTAAPTSGHAWSDGTTSSRTVSDVALAGPLGADSDACASKDATAGVTVTDPACGAAGVASISNVSFATLTSNGGVLDQGVGQHTATFTADANHRFADGSTTKNVTYTVPGPVDPDSDQCAGQDAAADVSVLPATCGSTSIASVTGLTFATLTSNGGVLDQTVGPHTATFTADANHRFADGTRTLDVPYTIAGILDPDSDTCAAEDATAGVSVSDPSCDSAGVASVTNLDHATLTSNGGSLDQGTGSHTATFTADVNHRFADGSRTKDVDYTIASILDPDSDACAAHDATAGVSVSDPSCAGAGAATVTNLLHATLDAPLDQSVGTHTAAFTADATHRFADGSKTKDVEYTIAGQIDADDDQCAGHDATGDVSVSGPSCDSSGVATVAGLAFATLDGELDQTVGTHTATFTAVSGHRFDDGSTTKDVDYTIPGQIDADDDQCAAHDSAAAVTVTDPGCDSAGTAAVSGLSFATLDGELDQTVGTHTATFIADSGHRFDDGSRTKDVDYTIAGPIDADDDQCADHDAAADVTVTEPGCTSAGTAAVSGLSFASLTSNGGVLDQAVGSHTATFTADADHRFADGSRTKDVDYTISAFSDQEYFDQCATVQPADEQRSVPQSEQGCELGGVHTWDDVYTTPYVWDPASRTWVLGEETGPVAENDVFTAYTLQQLQDLGCIEVEGEQGHEHGHHTPPVHHHPSTPSAPEVKGEQATVPTVVEAGLAGTRGQQHETPGGNPLWLMMIGAGLGMIALGRRRRNSL